MNELQRLTTSLNVLQVSTIKQAVKSESKSLSVIKKESGIMSQLFVELSIKATMAMIRAGKQINDDALPQIASMVLESYYWYKPEDVQLCLKMGASGRFGKNYDVFDVQTILQWFAAYDDIRTEEVRTLKNHAIDGSLNTIRQVLEHPQVAEIVKDVAVKLQECRWHEHERKIQGQWVEPTEEELNERKLINDLHNEYLTLRGSATFAEYNGKVVDATEYMKVRIKEIKQSK
jgi:hypothetical protein